MTTLIELRLHDCKAYNEHVISENIKLNAGNTARECDIHKFVEASVVYPILSEIKSLHRFEN